MNTKNPLIFSLTISLFLIILILLLPKFLPARLPLFYSLPWGESQLAESKQFLIIPSVILILSFINLLIVRQLHPQQILFKKILEFTSIFISIVLAITVFRIILIFI